MYSDKIEKGRRQGFPRRSKVKCLKAFECRRAIYPAFSSVQSYMYVCNVNRQVGKQVNRFNVFCIHLLFTKIIRASAMLASNKSIIFHVGHLYSKPPPNLLGLPLRPTPYSYPRSATPVEKFISADLFNSFSHIFFLYKISLIFSKSKKSSKKGLFSPETKKSSTFPAADNKKGLAFFFLLISKVHRYKIWTHVYY